MEALGVGLIGTGYMGKCHALAWNAVAPVFGDVPRPRLAVLCEATEDFARRRAREFGFENATADWRALVDHPEVDVVSITTPNHLHAEMAIYALERGKHVWCEKPMAPALADSERMLAAARASGRVAIVGYNYVQNPAVRQMRDSVRDGILGEITHVRVEMDEDFMADPSTPFGLRHEATSGFGALDDFGVHALSLITTVVGQVSRVFGHMAKPYAERVTDKGDRRAVETFDIATVLMTLENGASCTVNLNRAAWGRKGRIFVQIFGSRGSLVYDQERMNEVQLYTNEGDAQTRGFRTVLTGPQHKPYDRFIPAPGHGLGFNDLKVIECRQLLARIAGEEALCIDFEAGIRIERTVHAIAKSFEAGRWVDVA
jgi:predicted dehydrogenase